MIDTTSPDYLAGVAAGRRSFRMCINHTSRGKIAIVHYAYVAALGNSTFDFGPYSLTITDSMPHVETFPDGDLQDD